LPLSGGYAFLLQPSDQPGAAEERIDYEKLVDFFNQRGIDGLKNGITAEENEWLFTTPHIPEIIALVLQGLITVRS